MKACFCIGPQDGEPLCPCKMRERRKSSDFMRGYQLGLEQGHKARERPHVLRDNGR